MSSSPPSLHPSLPPPAYDYGRLIARLLCALMCLVGSLPLLAAGLTRSDAIRQWAMTETTGLMKSSLGLEAKFQLQLSLWPVGIELTDVELASTDGGSPALQAPRLVIRPRFFSLLAGKLSAGHITLESPHFRLVLRNSKLANLDNFSLTSKPNSSGSPLGFSSLAVTDASIGVDIGDTSILAEAVDLDIFSATQGALEVALRVSHGIVHNRRHPAHDEDVLCQLDARLRIDDDSLLVRRLSLLGAIDSDPEKDTPPQCDTNVLTDDPGRLLLRLSSLTVRHRNNRIRQATGHILLRAPISAVDRYLPTADISGWMALSGDLNLTEGADLPDFHGRVTAGSLHLDKFTLADAVKAEVHLMPGRVLIPHANVDYGDGKVAITGVSIGLDSPDLPMKVATATVTGLGFPSLMEGLGITPNTIVQWDLANTLLKDFNGTLSPLLLRGSFATRTRNFEVFDRSVHATDRAHMIGIESAHLKGTFGVHANSVRFDDFDVRFGRSSLRTSVHLGYDSTISLTIAKGALVELSDLSPLATMPLSGKAHLDVKMSGPMDNPELVGDLDIDGFSLAGFPLGNLSAHSLRFVPLRVQLPTATLKSGNSEYTLRNTLLDFDTTATLVATTRLHGTRFYLSDFYKMWHLDQDPRWDGISGQGTVQGKLKFVLGGPQDLCGGGVLSVGGKAAFSRMSVYDEMYRKTAADFNFQWFDMAAGHRGMTLNVPSLNAHKGSGTISGRLEIQKGGDLSADLLASRIPLSSVHALSAVRSAIGNINSHIEVRGSLDAMEATFETRITPVQIGQTQLPSSALSVVLQPVPLPLKVIGKTQCGAPLTPPFDATHAALDVPSGVFRVRGKLFGDQVQLDDVQVTRQANKHVRGIFSLRDFDVQALMQSVPQLAALDPLPSGTITGRIAVEDLPLSKMAATRAELNVEKFSVRYAATQFLLSPNTNIRLGHGRVRIEPTTLSVRTPAGQSGEFALRGTFSDLTSNPQVNLRATLKSASLDTFRTLIPNAQKATGRIEGTLSVSGPLSEPAYTGNAQLKGASIRFHGAPHFIDNLNITARARPGELRIEQARFSLGGGDVTLRATAPLRGMTLGEVQAYITARNVDLPLPPGLKASVNAELQARISPSAQTTGAKRDLPKIVGSVSLNSLSYSLPVKVSADITDLAQRGKRTEFDAYQLDGDFFSFDLNVRATEPMRLDNNLINASLTIENDVLHVTGTNQRFGVRGALQIAPGGHVHLRQNDFEIQQGRVRFDDPSRVVPLVDVTAVTDYRRYGGKTTSGVTTPLSGSNSNLGEWRVTMRAHGDAETLRIDLKSQPALSEDDIFLLLTVGMTRAEIDQLERSSFSETVALEALSALTGADQAVTDAIPVIDEFRFGSAYSPRTAQTETTITIGKQLSERIRAFVTSGVGESRDVRSNIQVKINRKISIEGSYDNVNDLSSSSLGNLGADVRWRLDFE